MTLLSVPHIPATHASRTTIWACGIFGLVQGASILAGGEQRWTGAAYAVLHSTPGGVYLWAVAAMACGALILAGSALRRFHLKGVGLLGLSAWAGVFGLCLVTATFTEATADTTGGPAHLLAAVVSAVLVMVDESEVCADAARA